jgi:small GTP-binding protein
MKKEEINEVKLPEKSRNLIARAWDNLPQADQENLKDIVKGIPLDRNPLNTLLDLVMVQFKITKGTKKHVAIIGPANVGKSTLYNQFIREKSDKAEVGPVPGTTRENQEGDAGLFFIIDTPGADAIGNVGKAEHDEAFEAADDADFIILLFDAIQGIKQTELDLYDSVLRLKKPHILIMNKIDLTRKYRAEVLAKAAQNLQVEIDEIIPISATKGDGISKVVMSIAALDPELLISLAQAMPKYRSKLAWRSIVSSSALSAAIALTPLPVIDFIPLVITQSNMVMTIARIYNYKITVKRAKELIATFGLGMLGRTLFQQLSKAGGLPGWLLSSAIASSMTLVMGYASIAWFEKGEKVSAETMKILTSKITKQMIAALKTKRGKRPTKQEISSDVIDVLQNTDLAQKEGIEEIIAETGETNTPG